MKVSEEKMQEIIDDLQGTCSSIDEVLNDVLSIIKERIE